ncbi:MAG TPA: DUF2219 family protein [Rhodobacterales bacterium]|nr:DUF2219 family protein [Rhodobacterales bacterium]
MHRRLIAALLILIGLALPAAAQERVTLGVGRLFTNDVFGDGQDRWHTGSYVASWVRGAEGTLGLPAEFGEVIEYRFSTRIIAPESLTAPAPGDRRYAGLMSLGAYSHFSQDGVDFSLGSELVLSGPATGLAKFQTDFHDLFGLPTPSGAVRAGQIANAVHPVLAFEAARPIAFGGLEGVRLRPFVQGRAGDETYLRAGVDLLIGPEFASGILARDETTGILYQTTPKAVGRGWSFLVGADATRVLQSAWLPSPGGPAPRPFRSRARAGLRWQGDHMGLFYGATWMGPEFAGQTSGQVVGSLSLRWRF